LTAAALLGPIVDKPEDPRYADVAAAIEQFQQGDVAGARTLLVEAAGKQPEIPPPDTLLGQMFFITGQHGAGRGALEAAAAQAPNDPEAYLLLADVALGEGRLTEASLLYGRGRILCDTYDQNARRKQRMQVGGLSGSSLVAIRREHWDEAQQALSQWLKLDPQSVEAQSRMARVAFFKGNTQQAYDGFQAVYKLDPSRPRPEISMGLLYEEQVARGDSAKRENARRAMQAAAQADPETLDTRLAVANWALEASDIDMAEENAAAALKLAPQSAEALVLSALAARHRSDAAKAQQALEAAHLQAPGDPLILSQLAIVLATPDDPQARAQSLDYARLAVAAAAEQGPAVSDATAALAWALYRGGRTAEAVSAVDAALQAGRPSEESAYLCAAVLDASGQRETALRLLEPALRSPRGFPTRAAAQALLEKLKAG
jgi:tetratricopeptide (TPR) repeat protein